MWKDVSEHSYGHDPLMHNLPIQPESQVCEALDSEDAPANAFRRAAVPVLLLSQVVFAGKSATLSLCGQAHSRNFAPLGRQPDGALPDALGREALPLLGVQPALLAVEQRHNAHAHAQRREAVQVRDRRV